MLFIIIIIIIIIIVKHLNLKFLLHMWQRDQTTVLVTVFFPLFRYTQAFSQNLKWPSEMSSRACSNEQFLRQHMENKVIFFRKWLSTGHLDTIWLKAWLHMYIISIDMLHSKKQ